MSNTLTRAGLTEALYKSIGLSRNESADLVEIVLEELLLSFERNENVKLTSFGTFKMRKKNERIGRNPKTGVEAKITSRSVISFKPSQSLKNKIEKNNWINLNEIKNWKITSCF